MHIWYYSNQPLGWIAIIASIHKMQVVHWDTTTLIGLRTQMAINYTL